jgi:hypothetical protein
MEAQTEHPGGVACKRASIQKVNPPPTSDNKSDNTRRGGWIMVPALRKLHRIGLWLRNSPIHSDAWDERIKLRLGTMQYPPTGKQRKKFPHTKCPILLTQYLIRIEVIGMEQCLLYWEIRSV